MVHIEVQGSTDKQFERRMLTYYYRILDKYDRDIASLAILTDKSKTFRPSKYEREFLGTSLNFKFKTYKVLDADIKELEASNNPFASVILVVQTALKKGAISDDTLFDLKIELVKAVVSVGVPQEEAMKMDCRAFLDGYLTALGSAPAHRG